MAFQPDLQLLFERLVTLDLDPRLWRPRSADAHPLWPPPPPEPTLPRRAVRWLVDFRRRWALPPRRHSRETGRSIVDDAGHADLWWSLVLAYASGETPRLRRRMTSVSVTAAVQSSGGVASEGRVSVVNADGSVANPPPEQSAERDLGVVDALMHPMPPPAPPPFSGDVLRGEGVRAAREWLRRFQRDELDPWLQALAERDRAVRALGFDVTPPRYGSPRDLRVFVQRLYLNAVEGLSARAIGRREAGPDALRIDERGIGRSLADWSELTGVPLRRAGRTDARRARFDH
ncbi:MAG: hypothetical protein JO352_18290 [Chloroflexi bacterium]|nr:hypothetical protein [Chloroflexota bacterium]MBV9599809.1 hypothetical protein [Chloroflexota bacterium]